jgi:hypothetical protein
MTPRAAVSALQPHFRFPLADARARSRFLVGSALLLAGFLIPVVPALFAFGYALQVMRRTIAGDPPSMHDWSDWSGMLKEGVRFWVVWFVYFLPGAATVMAGLIVYFVSFLGIGLASGAESEAAAFTAVLLGMAALFLSIGIGSVLMLAASIPLPAALGRMVAEDSLAAAFRFGQVWRAWRANALGFLIVWVLVMGLTFAAYLLAMLTYYTLVLLCLLPLLVAPAYFYVILVGVSLSGEVYAESAAQPAAIS